MIENPGNTQYTQLETVQPEAVLSSLDRLVSSKLPGFVIAQAGSSLEDALQATSVDKLLIEKGFIQLPEQETFGTYVIPEEDLADDPYITSTESDLVLLERMAFELFRGKFFHQDGMRRGEYLSCHYTSEGTADVLLHAPAANVRLAGNDEQSKILTRAAFVDGVIDTRILDPRGYRCTVTAGSLLVFDTWMAHAVASTQKPRVSEALFYADSTKAYLEP